MALRDDIPGINRSLLNVFTDDEWLEQKHTLVHEKWRERVRAKISGRLVGTDRQL